MKKLIPVLILFFLFSSCEDKKRAVHNATSQDTTAPENQESGSTSTEDYDLNLWVSEIDAEIENEEKAAYSLQFSNEQEEVQAILYYVGETPSRLDEKFSDYVTKTYGKRSYYLMNEQLVVSKEVKEELLPDSTYQMRETITFYENGMAKKSQTKVAPYEEELIYSDYTEIPVTAHPFKNTLDVLNREGDYETYFLDLVETSTSTFILLSNRQSPKKTTALMLEYRDSFANELLQNKKKYIGKKVEVEFEIASNQGMTYQAYRGGKFSVE